MILCRVTTQVLIENDTWDVLVYRERGEFGAVVQRGGFSMAPMDWPLVIRRLITKLEVTWDDLLED